MIWQALLAEPHEHLSAEDIVERVRERMPNVNTSTVYRTLEILVHDGLLLRTDLGGDRAYYELVSEHRHHHVICEQCGKVTHLHEEALGDLAARIEQDSGYRLGEREISFFGTCRSCLRSGDGQLGGAPLGPGGEPDRALEQRQHRQELEHRRHRDQAPAAPVPPPRR